MCHQKTCLPNHLLYQKNIIKPIISTQKTSFTNNNKWFFYCLQHKSFHQKLFTPRNFLYKKTFHHIFFILNNTTFSPKKIVYNKTYFTKNEFAKTFFSTQNWFTKNFFFHKNYFFAPRDKKLKCYNLKTQIVTNCKNSNCDKTWN